MNDPFLTRDWADHHNRFTAGWGAALGNAWRTLTVSLALLHRYEFDAPWKQPDRQRRQRPQGSAIA